MSITENKDTVDRLAAAVGDIFLAVLKHTDHGGDFKGLFTLNVGDTPTGF